MRTRKPYPSDVSDEEWVLVAPYLTRMKEDAPQREHSLREVVKLPQAKRGFVLLPRHWVAERIMDDGIDHAWMSRFRRLARVYELLAETLKVLHLLAFAVPMLKRFITLMAHYA